MKFVDPDRKELDIAYHFESVDREFINDFGKIQRHFSRYDSEFKDKGWLAIFLPTMINLEW
jgi:oligo-1,6-glucosidase